MELAKIIYTHCGNYKRNSLKSYLKITEHITYSLILVLSVVSTTIYLDFKILNKIEEKIRKSNCNVLK